MVSGDVEKNGNCICQRRTYYPAPLYRPQGRCRRMVCLQGLHVSRCPQFEVNFEAQLDFQRKDTMKTTSKTATKKTTTKKA